MGFGCCRAASHAATVLRRLLPSRSKVHSLQASEAARIVTLEDLGNIGEFVAAIAVVVSLVYLAIQIRDGARQTEHNTRALNLSAMNASQENFARRREWFIRDPRLYDLWERGLKNPTDLEPVDQQIFRDLMWELIFNCQIIYLQHREGMYDRWGPLHAHVKTIFETPGGRHLAGQLQLALNEEFVAEIARDPEGAASPQH